MEQDYYALLGVSSTATVDEIKARFRELAQEYHPDRHVNNPLRHLAQEHFKQITQAYHTLSDPKRRAAYDRDHFGSGQPEAEYEHESNHGGAFLACHKHTNEPAVAVCSSCGKGLCQECASQFTLTMCPDCLRVNNHLYLKGLRKALLIPPLLFGVPVILGLTGGRSGLVDGFQTGVMLVAIYWGWPIMRSMLPPAWLTLFDGGYFAWIMGVILSLVVGAVVGITVGLFRYIKTVFAYRNGVQMAASAEELIQQLEHEGQEQAS